MQKKRSKGNHRDGIMRTERNRTFDMVKVIATIGILLHHYQQEAITITGKNVHGFPINFYGGSFNWGYLVELFFLLSGFFMLPYIEKIYNGLTFYQFYTRRAARLLPLVAVSSVFCAAVLLLYDKIYVGAYYGTDPSIFGVVIQALGIQAGWAFKNPYLNNPTWYCSVLMLCYLIFFAIVYWSRRLRISPCYGFVFMIFLGCSVYTYKSQLPSFNTPSELQVPFLDSLAHRGFYSFFAGVLLAMLMPRFRKWRGTFWAGLVFLAVFAAAYYKKDGNLQYMPFLLTFLVYPVILLLLEAFPFRIISSFPFWEGWAKISYSAFIWHFPMYVLLYNIIKMLGMDPAVLVNVPAMFLCVAGMQLVAILSYRFLERPLHRKASEIFAALDPARQPEKI